MGVLVCIHAGVTDLVTCVFLLFSKFLRESHSNNIPPTRVIFNFALRNLQCYTVSTVTSDLLMKEHRPLVDR